MLVGVGLGGIDVGVRVGVGDVSGVTVGANLAISGGLVGVGFGGVQATNERDIDVQTIKNATKWSLSLAKCRFGIDWRKGIALWILRYAKPF